MKRTKNKIGLIFKIVHGMMRTTSKILCIISPGLAARWADMLFFIPIGLPRPTSELPYYESAIHSNITYNGKKVALYTWGEGDKTIILVHGWGSRGTRMGHLAEPLNKIGYRGLWRLTLQLTVIRKGKQLTCLKFLKLSI